MIKTKTIPEAKRIRENELLKEIDNLRRTSLCKTCNDCLEIFL